MKRWIAIAGALLLSFALGGFLVAASGIVPIQASTGHWAATEWMLQFGKRRSVATHTLGAEPLDLDAPWLVVKGAGHYETGCRPCHGSPELAMPRVARAMMPPPPYLPPRIAEWEPNELFYLVDHGIKLTGMPAWPTRGRDDEVLAMVAFLLAMPDMDAARYDALVHGEVRSHESAAPLLDLTEPMQLRNSVLASCARCHGIDGCGREVAAFPKLAGQPPDVLAAALGAYANDMRASGIMQPIAAGLDRDRIEALAGYYAGLPHCDADEVAADDAALARGREIARGGVPDDRVPSCEDCHGDGGEPIHPAAPLLAGQFAHYLELQLELLAGHDRGGSEYAELMHTVAERMSAQQMHDVARYYASLEPDAAAGVGSR